jgi:hypothetical protein
MLLWEWKGDFSNIDIKIFRGSAILKDLQTGKFLIYFGYVNCKIYWHSLKYLQIQFLKYKHKISKH